MGMYRGGRPRGTKNKRTDLHAACDRMEINVFEEMLLEVKRLPLGEQSRFNKLVQCAQYLYSKPKDEMDLNQFTPEEIRDYLVSLVKNVPSSA